MIFKNILARYGGTHVIPALGRWRQEDLEYKASLSYTGRRCLKKSKQDWALVAHACNPSYLGSRAQQDSGWRVNSLRSSKIPNTKKGCWNGLNGRMPVSEHKALSSNPSTAQKKPNKKKSKKTNKTLKVGRAFLRIIQPPPKKSIKEKSNKSMS
jgi:hypothetical protein